MFNKIRDFRIHLVLMIALLGSVTLVTPAFAAGITVNTVTDEDDTGASCSLREAIKAANTDASFGGCTAGSGSDTITLTAGVYTLTLGDQLPGVQGTIIINGNESTIQAAVSPNTVSYRVFEVLGGSDLTLKDVTIKNGHCDNSLICTSQSAPDNDKGRGGGIFNEGILTLSNVAITNNSAANSGGGIYHKAGTLNLLAGNSATTVNEILSNSAGSDGGGIASGGSGTITMVNAIFFDNKAVVSGGGVSTSGGTLDVAGGIFRTNSAGNSGGGIVSGGDLNVKTSSFHDNSADRGGGIFNGGGTNSNISNSTFYSNTATSNGGGISNFEDLTVTNSTFNLNSAANNGGAFYSDPYAHQNDSPVRFAVVTLKNTILANSTSGGDCFNFVNGVNVPITGNNNLIKTDSAGLNACGTTAPINNKDPKLGTLTGFPSPQFYPLLSGSPAIDAGNDGTCAAAPVSNTSQNGVTRPQGLHCDIGAYELAAKTNTTTALTSAPNPSAFGQTVVFTATVTGQGGTPTGNVTFSEGATTLGTIPLSNGVATFSKNDLTGSEHTITATYSGDATFNGSATSITQTVVGILGNLSTRGLVGTDDNVMIGGFIINGAPVRVLVRGIGPSMALPPFNVPGTLQDPVLMLFSGQSVIAENDSWQTGECPVEASENRKPKDPREACLVKTLNPGAYTAIVSGANRTTGVGLVDAYYLSGAGTLTNIATRLRVGTNDNVLIGGFIIAGGRVKVLVRGIGPSMANPPFNVPGTLQDPTLKLFSGQTVIAENDNWQTGLCVTEASENRKPKDPREACLVITLDPGAYTAIVSGVGGTTGVGLVDVFIVR